MEQVAVMQNIFYNKSITKTFDLKGSLRGRFATRKATDEVNFEAAGAAETGRKRHSETATEDGESEFGSEREELVVRLKGNSGTLLDGDFLEFTAGRPMPMHDRAKAVVHMSILNVSCAFAMM